ncbi:MAG: Gentisate 1,2-dioxygenase [Alphaproteobacteria bacterium MarineAlpha3_Bin7]|nr:MAG: Gentisate 1,2-dioxygenase [Alphaproteobacteria bacterium MarineAlpha3_Bin7]
MMENTHEDIKKDISPDRLDYYAEIKKSGMAPLWENLHHMLTPEPKVKSLPHHWEYSSVRKLLLNSANLISAAEAERRVLMLENPGLPGNCSITESLFAGLQLIMPGEVAPAHRHSPAALRFIIEGSGAYTAVNGEKTYMEPGDFVITPSWCWHDHGHEGKEPVVWLDGLDIPLVRVIGSIFVEHYPEERFPEGPPPGDSLERYGNNMRPVGVLPDDLNSPIFSYPYERSRETLEKLRNSSDLDPYHGLKLEYIDPTTGGPAISTISTFLQLMPKGFKSEKYQSTESLIYSPVEGSGTVIIGQGDNEQVFNWKAQDIFVIPCWHPHRFEIKEEAIVFNFSDKIVQTKLGLWRERRGNA